MRKTILLLLLLFCVVMLTGAEGSGCSRGDPDVDAVPVCDASWTQQECEDARSVMQE